MFGCLRLLNLSLTALIVLGLACAPAEAAPEEEEAVQGAPLPPGIPPIPGPRDRDSALLITQRNEKNFENIMLAPLAAWLKDGKFAMRAARSLDFNWTDDPAWEEQSKKNVSRYDFNPDFSLAYKSSETQSRGLPFGEAEDLGQESDPVRKAYKILWNIAYQEGVAGDLLYQTEIAWIGSQSVLRSAGGSYYRKLFFAPPLEKKPTVEKKEETKKNEVKKEDVAPPSEAKIGFGGPEDLLSQDALRLLTPPSVAGFTQFGSRYRGPQEDVLWLYSPVLKLIRPLLPSNRSDGMLGGSLTYDDIFVWSNKITSVRARVLDQKVLLVPFPALSFYKLDVVTQSQQPGAELSDSGLPPAKPAEGKPETTLLVKGYQHRGDGTDSMVLWNYQSRQLPQLAPWVPTTVTFVPRRVWIIELLPTDPYYGFGKEILIVDQELMLPVYKLVYDRIGEYRKTVIGGWGQAKSKDSKISFPFCAFVLAVDQTSQGVTSMTTQQVQTFVGRETRSAIAIKNWLDPTKYRGGQKEEKKEEGKRGKAEEQDSEAPATRPDD